ncbi:uncharacterized protein LOC133334506 [Musca vetustissima]|uniref:uncharacterized protein LOC133334506 n=1 Tax=Musca vetustissima TaxID=27455 RepID=UPI002AB6455E|nr:uncharacterized protein LOC133334506 [Musca vetustissima]
MNDDNGLSSAATENKANEGRNADSLPASVSAVYARLPFPQMCNSNIEAWFVTMDFWFTASGIISDKQKAATVLTALSPNVISQLTEVIAAIPVTDRFDYIRRKIIEHFADSEQRRLNRLLSELPLGDRKPSELYFEMKRVAGSTLGEAALKGLWTKRLPQFVQPVVAASTGTAAEFTKIADSIVDAVSPGQLCQVRDQSKSELNDLRAAIVEMGKELDEFSLRSRSRSRRPTTGRNQSRRRDKSQNNNDSFEECWYHRTYGRKAQKCRSPCKYKQHQANEVRSGENN